jgi:NADH-quinone oxidoreductase subunit C
MAKTTQESPAAARSAADAQKLFPILEEKFPAAIVEKIAAAPGFDPILVVRADALREIAVFCRDDEALRFDLLNCISGIDYPPADGAPGSIEVVYALDSTVHKHRLLLKLKLPRDDPRAPSLETIWRAADWHERETFDLFGVIFEGHHNLVRILCAEDWEGHALRKDYVIPERYHGIKNIVY